MMSLPTFVQLQILIYAAPALAGWLLMPLAQPQLVRTAPLACQSVVEAVPAAIQETRQATESQPHYTFSQRLVVAAPLPPAKQPAFAVETRRPFVSRFQPFPHAARAP